MSIRNHNWYDLQSTRDYPIDEGATALDDTGQRLVGNVLVDCNIRFPETAGRFAFLGGITVTANLVTLTILGADSPTAASSFTPIASVTLTKPVDEYRHYAVDALQPGVGGWVVFGNGILEPVTWRFSSPLQSLLMPKTARPYSLPPLTSLGKQFRSTVLTGVVNLVGDGDVEIVKELVPIDGTTVDALVIRLKGNPGGRDPLEVFAGPCEKRPESDNCNRPGIQRINNVQPDCDGNITIDFRNLLDAPFADCGGIAIDTNLGLDEACDVPRPTRLFRDLCEPFLSSAAEFASSQSSAASDEDSFSLSSSSRGCNSLPFIENFDFGAPNWLPQKGLWIFEKDDSPEESSGDSSSVSSSASVAFGPVDLAYVSASGGISNISIIPDCSGTTLGRLAITDLLMTNEFGSRNAGIVINHHNLLSPTPHVEYYFVYIDQVSKSFKLLRWNGFGYLTEFTLPGNPPFQLGEWYRLTAEVQPGPGPSQVTITASVRGITNPTFPSATFSVAVSQFLPANGSYGLGTINAKTRFSFFSLEAK